MIIAIKNVYCKAIAPTPNESAILFKALSYEIPNAQHIERKLRRKYKKPSFKFNSTKSFYDQNTGLFLTGFLGPVTRALQSCGVTVEYADTRSNPVKQPWLNEHALKGITLHDYQERAFQEFMKAGRGVAKIATGGGKTELFIACAKALRVPSIFMTHRINLLNQGAARLIKRAPEFKGKIGVIGDGQIEPNFITFAMVQTLFQLVKKHPEYARDLLSGYQFVTIDEAHRSGASQFHYPAIMCQNAYYRLALTATPFMKGNRQDDMMLLGITGGIVTNVTNGELIERGILARPYFKFFEINSPKLWRARGWREIYEEGIIYNELRNRIITTQAVKLVNMGRKILVIVQEAQHGHLLAELIHDAGVRIAYMDGKNAADERERALALISKDKLDAIVATNIFDEGIDVNEISGIVLAAGTKSAPALFQRTGRAIRRKADENYAIVIDFVDNTHKNLYEHSIARYELVKNEPGFVIL